jgi:hypothetical protein
VSASPADVEAADGLGVVAVGVEHERGVVVPVVGRVPDRADLVVLGAQVAVDEERVVLRVEARPGS